MNRDTILVVDDDRLVREVVARLVRTWGWRVVTAHDLESAHAVLRAEIGRIAAVLSDDHMGGYGRNGADLYFLHSLDFTRHEIPFFLMTGGCASHGFALAAEEFGMHVVPKPFRSNSLLERVRAWVKEWPTLGGGTEQ